MTPTPSTETASGITRTRRIIAGETMVTPTREVTIGGERLRPGRDRFSVTHEYVRAHPEMFRGNGR
jgi:hypothetical protein